jgi:site-specific recombinase XerD
MNTTSPGIRSHSRVRTSAPLVRVAARMMIWPVGALMTRQARFASVEISASGNYRANVRHTTATYLLRSGVPFNVIALWLGPESTNTTHR